MKIINNPSDYFDMLRDLAHYEVLYMDTETTGLDPYTSRFLLLQIHTGDENYIVDFLALDLNLLKMLQYAMSNERIVKVFHNAVFDWKMLHHNGVDVSTMHCTLVTDQMLNAGLLSGYSLADVAKRRLDIIVDKSVREQFINRDVTVPFTKEELEYAALDTEILIPIYQQQQREITEKQLERVYELECNLLPATASMEYTGLLVDKQRLDIAKPLVSALIDRSFVGLQDSFIEHGAANQIVFSKDGYLAVKPSSNQQMLAAFRTVGIDVESTKSGELAEWDTRWAQANITKLDFTSVSASDETDFFLEESDDADISSFHHPLLKKHDIRKTAAKLKGTFLDGIDKSINPVTHRVHAGYNQCGASSTGRYSSSGPNFQTMVKPSKIDAIGLDERCYIRPLFIASPGYQFIIADYSGIELAILAMMSDDAKLVEQVLLGDVHSYVANNLEGEKIQKLTGSLITPKNKKDGVWGVLRDTFKKVSFSIIYGTTEHGMYNKQYMQLMSINFPFTMSDAKRWLHSWKTDLFPDTGAFLAKNAESAVTRRYTESVLGRKRFWPIEILGNKWRAMSAMREGMNQPIQASSADMTKTAIYMLHNRLDKRYARVVATVHDEIIVEVKDERAAEYQKLTEETMIEAGYSLFPNARPGMILVESALSNCYNK